MSWVLKPTQIEEPPGLVYDELSLQVVCRAMRKMGNSVVGDSFGVALWALFLLTARFPVGPCQLFFHLPAWQHFYLGSARVCVHVHIQQAVLSETEAIPL